MNSDNEKEAKEFEKKSKSESKLTVMIKKETKKKLRIFSFTTGKTLKHICEEAFNDFLMKVQK